MTVEQKAGAAILETPVYLLEIGGRSYLAPPPTTATLIMVSQIISQLPDVGSDPTPEDALSFILNRTHEFGESVGVIAATLILGAKRIAEHPEIEVDIPQPGRWWSWKKFRRVSGSKPFKTRVNERMWLAERLLMDTTPAKLNDIVSTIFAEGAVDDFFVLTTSLKAKNILKPTREVVKQTARGRSSTRGAKRSA